MIDQNLSTLPLEDIYYNINIQPTRTTLEIIDDRPAHEPEPIVWLKRCRCQPVLIPLGTHQHPESRNVLVPQFNAITLPLDLLAPPTVSTVQYIRLSDKVSRVPRIIIVEHVHTVNPWFVTYIRTQASRGHQDTHELSASQLPITLLPHGPLLRSDTVSLPTVVLSTSTSITELPATSLSSRDTPMETHPDSMERSQEASSPHSDRSLSPSPTSVAWAPINNEEAYVSFNVRNTRGDVVPAPHTYATPLSEVDLPHAEGAVVKLLTAVGDEWLVRTSRQPGVQQVLPRIRPPSTADSFESMVLNLPRDFQSAPFSSLPMPVLLAEVERLLSALFCESRRRRNLRAGGRDGDGVVEDRFSTHSNGGIDETLLENVMPNWSTTAFGKLPEQPESSTLSTKSPLKRSLELDDLSPPSMVSSASIIAIAINVHTHGKLEDAIKNAKKPASDWMRTRRPRCILSGPSKGQVVSVSHTEMALCDEVFMRSNGFLDVIFVGGDNPKSAQNVSCASVINCPSTLKG